MDILDKWTAIAQFEYPSNTQIMLVNAGAEFLKGLQGQGPALEHIKEKHCLNVAFGGIEAESRQDAITEGTKRVDALLATPALGWLALRRLVVYQNRELQDIEDRKSRHTNVLEFKKKQT